MRLEKMAEDKNEREEGNARRGGGSRSEKRGGNERLIENAETEREKRKRNIIVSDLEGILKWEKEQDSNKWIKEKL